MTAVLLLLYCVLQFASNVKCLHHPVQVIPVTLVYTLVAVPVYIL
jgi:hypothetical protein